VSAERYGISAKKDCRDGSIADVSGTKLKAFSDACGNWASNPTGSSDEDCWPVGQHVVRDAPSAATFAQHGNFPPPAEMKAVHIPKLMLAKSTRSSEVARARRRPDICLIVVRPSA